MMVDPTIKETEINGGKVVSSKAANQGNNLYSLPLNYDINSIPFGTETNAKGKKSTLWPRDTPHDEVLPMQPTNSQS